MKERDKERKNKRLPFTVHPPITDERGWLRRKAFLGKRTRDEAFRWLNREYGPKLERYMSRKGVPPMDIDDIRQKCLLNLLTAVKGYTAEINPVILFVLAHNLMVDRIRRALTRSGELKELSLESLGDGDKDFWPDPEDMATAVISRVDLGPVLETAFHSLSPRQEAAAVLHFQSDLSPKETAKAMGGTRSGTRILLFRARRNLQKTLLEMGISDE